MRFKESWKKLRAVSGRDEGFTLVELIVVIAILGILAGIGTVGYSGYIKKAQTAADEILLDSLNTAFAAACIENGEDAHNLSATPTLTWSGKTVSAVSIYNDDFLNYYEEDSEFKVITASDLVFVKELGAFVNKNNSASGMVKVTYNGVDLYLSQADIDALNDSTFIIASGLGVDGLLDKVNDVAVFAGAADSAAFDAILADEGYRKSLAKYLGVTNASALSGDDLATAIESRLTELGIEDEAELQNVVVNGTVLYAAEHTQKQSQSEILAMLTSGNAKSTIVSTMNNDQGAGLAQAAVAYGMYTAYAHYKNDSTLIANTEDPIAILNGLEDEGFQKYLETDQAKTDLAGYLSALNMVNESSANSDISSGVLVNGFNDQGLKDVLTSALNQ